MKYEELAKKSDIVDKLTQPTTAQVGQIFKVKSINDDGSLVLGAADMPSSVDVRIDGSSIVQDGVAKLYSDDIVKSGLTSQSPAWTDEEKARARERIGMKDFNSIAEYQTAVQEGTIPEGTICIVKRGE